MIELAVIIPSYNERDNVRPMIERLDQALQGIEWEAIYVDDDSKDKTYELVREIAQTDPRIRCIHRVGRRGLSSAAIEGMMATSAPYIAVIDADLQHDERILPQMLQKMKQDNLEVVVGSRYIEGGGVGQWDGTRQWMSQLATKLGQLLIRCQLSDPMSGYFMVQRSFLLRVVPRLSGRGYKILLDLFATAKVPVLFAEVPYQFRDRHAGESKLSIKVLLDYGLMLLEKGLERIVTKRFAAFVLVGMSGVMVHMMVLWFLAVYLDVLFVSAQFLATVFAMTTNYAVNNAVTFRDRQRTGAKWLRGLFSFYVACSVGAVFNIVVATMAHQTGISDMVSGLIGIAVGSVFNFVGTSLWTWPRHKKKPVS